MSRFLARFLRAVERDTRDLVAPDRRAVQPPSGPPVTSISEVVARMHSIESALPHDDGIACFNRMYLGVTDGVAAHVTNGLFADPAFVTRLDVVFANYYFDAIDALTQSPQAVPTAWRPLFDTRTDPRIESVQFALAGMNAHINHDLPLAVVLTCAELATAPDDGSHHEDYQRVDVILDAAEQAVRESFEPHDVEVVDRHVARVLDVVANWSMNSARDVAWNTSLALWQVRDRPDASTLLLDTLARTVAMASRGLLVHV